MGFDKLQLEGGYMPVVFLLLLLLFIISIAGPNNGPGDNPDTDGFTDVLDPGHHFALPPGKLP
jgi:hypothetical protein